MILNFPAQTSSYHKTTMVSTQHRKEQIMKNATLITLLVSGIAFTAIAQEREPRHLKSAEEIAQMRTARLNEKLALSEDQQKEVYALNLEKAEKMKAAHAERAAKMVEMRKVRAANMAERQTEMKATQERLNEILNEEQREMLNQERTEKMKSMKEGRKNGEFKGERFKRGKKDFRKKGFHKKTDRTHTADVSSEVK